VGELIGEIEIFIAAVSDKLIVDQDTVRYPKKTDYQLKKSLTLQVVRAFVVLEMVPNSEQLTD
jgi:hypothetical protein